MNALEKRLNEISLQFFLLEFHHQRLTNEERAMCVRLLQAEALRNIADAMTNNGENQ